MAENTVEPKKKRGRPKKIDHFAEFPDNIKELSENYLDIYNKMLTDFYSSTKRLTKSEWQIIYEHVKSINNILGKTFPEYAYKPNTQWKLLDDIHENMRKEYVKDIISKEEINEPLKTWLVLNHLSVYIAESSAQLK